ncbi:hypothetical protein B7Z28_00070 [Candidatus Saccharibacteria bacterium 32-45-3]|nr:MAG: hypothetical protein B7Z28_00070 [Candidatus Saccharibacteria bacterium 32-45-3]
MLYNTKYKQYKKHIIMKKPYTLTVLGQDKQAGIEVVRVQTIDKYDTTRFLVAKTFFQGYMQVFEWYLKKHPEMRFEDRNNLARIISYSVPGTKQWGEYMPGGFATHYVYQAKAQRMKNGTKINPITARFFRYNVDGYGLRSRSYVLSWLVEQWAKGSNVPLRWLSIAGGAGQPMFDALKILPEETQRQAHFTLADLDKEVIEFAKEVYEEQEHLGIASATFTSVDVFNHHAAKSLLEDTKPNVVDAMGLFEYADENQARDLVASVYSALPVGGMFIFTNMAHDRPHLRVHKHMIGWPGVTQRSLEEVVNILEASGVGLDELTAYQPSDGVYNIYRVVKL